MNPKIQRRRLIGSAMLAGAAGTLGTPVRASPSSGSLCRTSVRSGKLFMGTPRAGLRPARPPGGFKQSGKAAFA